MDPAPRLSQLLGMDEGGIRLLVTLIASFLLGYPYNSISHKLSPTLQHILNIVTGIAFMYYCFGSGIVHTLFDICVIAILLKLAGGTLVSVLITWALVFGHLLWGYYQEREYFQETGERWPINWSTAQCVVTLKLIGLATSLYDAKIGKKIDPKSSTDSKFSLDSSQVDVVEVVGFCCLFCTSIVGPQIPFRRYRDFVNGTLYDRENVGGNLSYALNRFGLSLAYVVIYLLLSPYNPPHDYFLTQSFAKEPFFNKVFLNGLHYFIFIKKYILVWLIAEAGCIATGISYKSYKDGSFDWTEARSVDPYKWETATSAQSLIASINISVNHWMIHYVYKRFRFLNAPTISHLISMLFIVLWHGLFPGIFLTYFCQVPFLKFDKSFENFSQIYLGGFQKWPLMLRTICYLIIIIYHQIVIGFAYVPFYLLTFERSIQFWGVVYYYGLILFFVEYVLGIWMDILVKRSEKHKKS